MPYPKITDPDYCPGSRKTIANLDRSKVWHRCDECGRPICEMGNTGTFFPHVKNRKRARRGDAVQESLIAHGLNSRERLRPTGPAPVYAEAES